MINNVSQTLGNAFGTAAKSAFTPSPELQAAQGYATDVLGGKYLGASNPYLNGMIDQTNQGVSNAVNTEFGAAGRTGGGAHVQNLTQGLANADNALRYQQYNDGINQMNTTLGQIPGLESARYAGYAPTIALGQAAAGLPLDAASQYAGGIGSLVGNYNTQTTTQKQGLGSTLGGLLGAGLAGWASGGFKGA